MNPGFFPAYHMDKTHWITVALDGTVSDDDIMMLLDMSYELTLPKKRKKYNAASGRVRFLLYKITNSTVIRTKNAFTLV